MTPRYPRRSLAACMLPWTTELQLDVPVFAAHVQAAVDAGFKSIYLMGTAGEGYALDDARFKQVVEVFAELTVGGDRDPQIGVISLSMAQIIERLRFAYERGIRMFQISLPAWGALDEGETLAFFHAVCDRFPDCRFLHYNLPRARRIIYGPEYRRLADEIPNLVATKNSTTDYVRTAGLLQHAPDLQHFLLELNFAMGCTIGECSLLCSEATLFPKQAARFFAAGERHDLPELFRLTEFFRDVVHRLFAHCTREMIDGAYDKTFIWLRHPEFPTRLLPPYQGLSDAELATCRKVFDEHYGDVE